MADSSWQNAYGLLEESNEGEPAAKPKQRKKNKKKAASDQPIAAAAAAPQAEARDDFQVVAGRQGPRGRAAKPAAPGGIVKAVEASDALEKAAKGAIDCAARSELVVQWREQAIRSDQQFQDGAGTKLTFAQVLAQSKALERLLDGYLTSSSGAVSAAEASSLSELLVVVTHPSLPPQFSQLLAHTVAALSSLLATDALVPAATVRRSLEAAVALLKAGVPAQAPKASPAARLQGLEASLSKQEAALARTTLPKEQGRLWMEVVDTLSEQLDTLEQEGQGAPPKAVDAALRPLKELQGALETRHKAATAPAQPSLSVEEQLAGAEAAHKHVDSALAAQLSAAEARIKRLEAELAAAKAEAGALRAQRSAAEQDHHRVVEQLTSGAAAAASAQAAGAVAAALEAGLGAARALQGAIEGAAGTKPAAHDAGAADALVQRLVAQEVPAKLVGAVQQVVDLNLALLQDLGGKAAFYRERLAQSARQAEQLVRLKLDDAKTAEDAKRQRGSLERMLREVVAGAEAAAKAARGAVDAYRQRLPALLRLPGFAPPPAEYSAGLEAKAEEAGRLFKGIVDPSQAAAAPVPATAAPAVPSASAPHPVAPPTSQQTAAEPIVPAPPPAAGRSAAPGSGRQKPAAPAPAQGAAAPLDMSSLEARLAVLEEANRQKDAQIAAMLSSAAAVDVSTPLEALAIPLSSGLLARPLGLMPSASPSTTLAPLANGHGPDSGIRREDGKGRRGA